MKIFVAHATNWDSVNKLYTPLRNCRLNQEHEFILPQEGGRQKIFTAQDIKNCDLVIAEVSHPSTGQGIELGWANMHKVPILCIYEKGNAYSGAIPYVTDQFIEYENGDDMVNKLTEYLQKL